MSSVPRVGIPRSLGLVLLGLACALAPAPAGAQRLGQQDRLDFQVPASVVQGSGARAFGMGGAFLARADDATAASWNPAGLSYLRRPEVSVVWTGNRFTLDNSDAATGVPTETQQRRGDWPDFVSGAWPVRIRSLSGAAQVSYQRAISFTNTRTITTAAGDRTVDASSTGGFDVLALGSALQVSRRLRLGFTVNSWLNGFEQDLTRRRPSGDSSQKLDFDLSGWNAHVGLLFSPVPSVNLGAAFKTPFEASVHMARSRTDAGDPPTTNSFPRDDVRLRMPGALGVGLSWRVRSSLTISADYTRSFWSDAEIYNFFTLGKCIAPGNCPVPQLVVDPDAPEGPGGGLYPRLPYPTLTEDQRDTQELRAGLEYVIFRRRFKWPLRVGAFTDRQYFTDDTGQAPRFRGLTVGTGLIVGPVMLDAAFVYEWGDYRTDSGEALVDTSVRSRRLLFSAIYRHGGR